MTFLGPISITLLASSIAVFALSFLSRRESLVLTAGFLGVSCLIGVGVQWIAWRAVILGAVDLFVAVWLFRLWRSSHLAPVRWVCLLTLVAVAAHIASAEFPVFGVSYGKLLNILFILSLMIVAISSVGLAVARWTGHDDTEVETRLFRRLGEWRI